jgi:hypothetical protein
MHPSQQYFIGQSLDNVSFFDWGAVQFVSADTSSLMFLYPFPPPFFVCVVVGAFFWDRPFVCFNLAIALPYKRRNVLVVIKWLDMPVNQVSVQMGNS